MSVEITYNFYYSGTYTGGPQDFVFFDSGVNEYYMTPSGATVLTDYSPPLSGYPEELTFDSANFHGVGNGPPTFTATVTADSPYASHNPYYICNVDYRIADSYGEQGYVEQGFRSYTVVTPPAPPPPPNAPSVATPLGSYALAEDAHGRPCALSPNFAVRVGIGISGAILEAGGYYATSINGLVSNTAGKTYLLDPVSDVSAGYAADNFGADNPSLLVDRRSNHFRAIYSLSPSYTYGGAGQTRPPDGIALASGLISDRFTATVALIPGVSGGLCVAAQHPTDADYALLVYSDIGTAAAPGSHDLKAAFSADAGATWQPLSTVLPALDLTLTGRPALCWLGNTVILVYSAGNALRSLSSVDRGKTWTAAPAPVSVYTPNDGATNVTYGYYCLSAASHGGEVYLLAFAGDTQASPQPPPQTSPRLFVSGDGGRAWVLRAAEAPGPKSAPAEYGPKPPGALPAIPAPSGLGVSAGSGLLRLDTSGVSHDCGLSWSAP